MAGSLGEVITYAIPWDNRAESATLLLPNQTVSSKLLTEQKLGAALQLHGTNGIQETIFILPIDSDEVAIWRANPEGGWRAVAHTKELEFTVGKNLKMEFTGLNDLGFEPRVEQSIVFHWKPENLQGLN